MWFLLKCWYFKNQFTLPPSVLDLMPQVKHWVRNLVRREAASSSLPLANSNFYPDFIVELNDGRILIIEYKGEVYKSNDDSAEKMQWVIYGLKTVMVIVYF